ncbi:MAG: hypothetical protein HGB19_09660 [Chlorobiales bacterium]|jgi:hypothetical protein|nr:hypothetical protein [Chlorobiales bacterium]
MNTNTSKLLLIVAVAYIISQAVLIAIVGKDMELIVLSFGIFIASVLLIVAFQNSSFGRVKLESVSMRRASQSREKQAEMIGQGYDIDQEFLKQNAFGSSSKKLMNTDFGSGQSGTTGALFPKTGRTAALSDNGQPETRSIESAILANAPLYGGIEKLHEAARKMDDKAIESLVVRMGYKNVSATEVREVIVTLKEQKVSSTKTQEANGTDGLAADNYRPKVSLDATGFNDYIRRCMSGDPQEHKVKFIDDSNPATSNIPIRALKRMRGIRASNGGQMRCDNCTNLDRASQICQNANLLVEKTDVCDAWKPSAPIA